LQRDFLGLLDLCEKDKRFWRVLWATLYSANEQVRWPAIEAVAKVMGKWWEAGQKDRVQEYVRRFLWSLTDEAGEMGWSAPQVIAEIIISVPELIEPYASMMICRALEEPTLVPGGLWGIGRLGVYAREEVESLRDVILSIFGTEDAEILGLAAWAMGEVGFEAALPYLVELRGLKEPSSIYIDSHFHRKTIGQWAEEAIAKIAGHSTVV